MSQTLTKVTMTKDGKQKEIPVDNQTNWEDAGWVVLSDVEDNDAEDNEE